MIGKIEDDLSEIGKCSRCNAILTLRDFSLHNCNLPHIPIDNVREIAVEHYYEIKSNKDMAIMAKGLDGVLYRLVCIPRQFIPFIISEDSYHDPESDDKLPEPFRARNISKDRQTVTHGRKTQASCTNANRFFSGRCFE